MGHVHFSAAVIVGRGRGTRLGTPTLNLDLDDVPAELSDGVYACRVNGDHAGAMHLGLRPTFGDTKTCEVHLLDGPMETKPERITIDVIQRLRDVRTFDSPEELKRQIADDIGRIRAMLSDS